MKAPSDTYLHVRDCRSGEEWAIPIADHEPLDLAHHVDAWIRSEFCGEAERDGDIVPLMDGEYYAKVMIDGDDSDAFRCWSGAGFYIRAADG